MQARREPWWNLGQMKKRVPQDVIVKLQAENSDN